METTLQNGREIKTLRISHDFPLSPQLIKLTGDGWNTQDFESLDGSELTSFKPFRHKKTGKIFIAEPENPMREFYDQGGPINGQTPYVPESKLCESVDTIVPPSMRYELKKALETVGRRVNGVDAYVAWKLGYSGAYCTPDEKTEGLRCMCEAFSAEQVDALALAIYNIEEKHQGCIVADQTGVGKGRVAAGMIRYAIEQGMKPVFLTAKSNLFTDIYRDILDTRKTEKEVPAPYENMTGYKEVKRATRPEEVQDISELDEDGEEGLEVITRPSYGNNKDRKTQNIGRKFIKPFIVNNESRETDIKDTDGNVLFRSNMNDDHKRVIDSADLTDYDFICATYSQFAKAGDSPKKTFLQRVAQNSVIVMDESHKAAGDSNTGKYFMDVLTGTKGVVFLSATFAKRPDNMPVYATKTAMIDASMSVEQLIEAIRSGGEALQEVLSSQLVAEQQLIRRERSFENVEVNWWALDKSQIETGHPDLNYEDQHKAMSDGATGLLNSIIDFQETYVNPYLKAKDKALAAEYAEVKEFQGRRKLGVDKYPIFSVVFNFIYNLLFAIKAEATAKIAIQRLKEGKSVLVVFARTMESFLDNLENDEGNPVKNGDVIPTDFSSIGKMMLTKTLQYKVKTPERPEPENRTIGINEMPSDMRAEYTALRKTIDEISTGITFSPIDVLRTMIEEAGYNVEELTGRSRRLKLLDENKAVIESRPKPTITEAVRKFQNNQIDCLLMNQTAATGASMHAIFKGTGLNPKDVRQRAMIILQPELDINIEIQKRGRINRVGQIHAPIYDYVVSAVPSEMRMMFMLRKKLRSLDANTTSSQQTSQRVLDVDDFLNRYGDEIVFKFLEAHPAFNVSIGDPAGINKEGEPDKQNLAHRASGRVAILTVKEQEGFYEQITSTYESEIDYLKQTGEYDLEVQTLNLEAETITREIAIVGSGGLSAFGRNTILEKNEVNILKKPMKAAEIKGMIKELMVDAKGTKVNAKEYTEKLRDEFKEYIIEQNNTDLHALNERFVKKIEEADEEQKKQFEQERNDRDAEIRKGYDRKTEYLSQYFEEFIPGNAYAYPSIIADADSVKAVFLGYKLNRKAKNPFAPSAIRAVFALASNDQKIELPMSKDEKLNTILQKTKWDITEDEKENILKQWDELVKEQAAQTRHLQYIVTGNILQAFAKEEFKNGRLIDFTTKDGGRRKGILMPAGFTAEGTREQGAMRVTMPILKALPYIKSLTGGSSIQTSGNLSIIRVYHDAGDFKLFTPKGRQKYGKYFLDKNIMALTLEGEFATDRGNMVATIPAKNIGKLVNGLHNAFKETVELQRSAFESIKEMIDVGATEYPEEREQEPADIRVMRTRDEEYERGKAVTLTKELEASGLRMEQDSKTLELLHKLSTFGDILQGAHRKAAMQGGLITNGGTAEYAIWGNTPIQVIKKGRTKAEVMDAKGNHYKPLLSHLAFSSDAKSSWDENVKYYKSIYGYAKGGPMLNGGSMVKKGLQNGEAKYKVGDKTKLGIITDIRVGFSVKQFKRQIGFKPKKQYQYHIGNDWYNEGQVEYYINNQKLATA